MFLPSTFPARNGHTGKFLGPVSTQIWVIGGVTLLACIIASGIAFRGSRADKVAAGLAAVFIILVIVMYAEAIHWTDRGRARSVPDADALSRPRRSVFSFGV